MLIPVVRHVIMLCEFVVEEVDKLALKIDALIEAVSISIEKAHSYLTLPREVLLVVILDRLWYTPLERISSWMRYSLFEFIYSVPN